ncbi:hypothetical protein [Gracilibacillus kekensis]|uniref:Uncharacterized protein n=1 Tax=Gracilibacillus kekensis TaxID=1027249 RepID=A0A1M7NZL7_9BACI|nr:hypothetical protein [Gracilibacillus kekensis]SHN09688.1 hypothetical protein SAMN05216179_1862 [Gracilibacillus kekensis]
MRTSYKHKRTAATNHFQTNHTHQYKEYQQRDYQTEIAAQFDIALHSTQKIAKNKKRT